MSRIRLYHCNKCGKYGLTPGSKGSNKYKCRYCKTEVDSKDVNTHEWKDGDGDIITKDGIKSLDGEMENTLMNTIAIQENAKDIVALIPPATRSMYPEDDVQAALKFYNEHREWFEQ